MKYLLLYDFLEKIYFSDSISYFPENKALWFFKFPSVPMDLFVFLFSFMSEFILVSVLHAVGDFSDPLGPVQSAYSIIEVLSPLGRHC